MAAYTTISTSAHFAQMISSTQRLMVIHFAASWAPQCEQMDNVIAELAKDKQLSTVTFIKVEAEEVPDVSEQHSIASVPTFIFYKNKKEVDRLEGANVAEFTQKVKQNALIHGGIDTPKLDLNTRLKNLINASDVMIFMKGTPAEPKCGFSRQLVTILNENEITYKTFNILSDDDVRQGLKSYSDWPTYPQVYAKGELIGGLDIIKELVSTNELKEQLGHVDMKERLKTLINTAPVMLFMKGTPDEPRCGFSRTVTTLLNETQLPYKTFNILTDDAVRQGLKTYSDWPTYPQLYVKGELIGGLDILKELKESGELISTLKGE